MDQRTSIPQIAYRGINDEIGNMRNNIWNRIYAWINRWLVGRLFITSDILEQRGVWSDIHVRHVVGDVDGKMAIELRNVEVCPECKTTGIVEFVENGQSTWECVKRHKFKKPLYITVIKELKEQE